MTDERWARARLIPTSGINGQEEAERRATSALLAVMSSVREFGGAIIRPLGAPSGPVDAFIEVPFDLGERKVFPDGLVQTTRASKTWTALVEVKTGSAELTREQIESYLDVARDQGFNALLTISNQIAPAPGVHPVNVDKRKTKTIALHHISWAEVLTIAVQQRVHRGVADPDQAWILGELIRYLEHPKSGALDFSDMGPAWVAVREAVSAGTLRGNDKGLPEVLSRWDQLLRFAALRLGRELGADVQLVLSRKELADPSLRRQRQIESIVKDGLLTGSIRIPDAISALDVTADLRGGRVVVSADVDAPKEGRSVTRVNWLTRQLKDCTGALRIDAWSAMSRTSTSELLSKVREEPGCLVADPRKELRVFRLASLNPIGTKRGTGRGSFIESVVSGIEDFYREVVQQLRPWSARAPQLPTGSRTAVEESGLDLTPPSGDFEARPLARDRGESFGGAGEAAGGAEASDLSGPAAGQRLAEE